MTEHKALGKIFKELSYGGHSGEEVFLKAYELGKKEIAKEIFNELEKISNEYKSGYLKGSRRYFVSHFDKLKEKYLGEKV